MDVFDMLYLIVNDDVYEGLVSKRKVIYEKNNNKNETV